jgi:hypothetical protein
MHLGLEVVDDALGNGRLVLIVPQSGAGVIEVIGLEVTTAISPHQLIIQLPDACLQVGVLGLPSKMSLMTQFMAFT